MRRCRPEWQGGMHHGTFKATARREGAWREGFVLAFRSIVHGSPIHRLLERFALNRGLPKEKAR